MDEEHHHSLREFYFYYLTEHQHPANRFLHFVGTSLFILLLIHVLLIHQPIVLIGAPIVGYGFAWIGHFYIEKNKPATFKYPFYSLASDFIMFWDILNGRIHRKLKIAKKMQEQRKLLQERNILIMS
jgi:hypothetical protein